jgi:predicted permease
MAAAMPTGVNTYVLAEQYQSGRQIASAAILISTILALGSQALLLAWLS